jgi:hypothetical protein
MDENNPNNQEPLEKKKVDQLENELENLGKKAVQEIPPQPSQPVQQSNTPQPTSSIPPVEAKPQRLSKSKGILWIGVVLMGLAAVGVGAYYLGSQKNADTSISEPAQTQTPTPIPDPTANWKTHTTKDSKFLIKYPEDWVLEDKSKEVDLFNDGNVQLSQDISISKNGHIFRSYNPLAWGPNACLFPDSQSFEGSYQEFKNFIEIKTSKFTYRRPKITELTSADNLQWTICRKDDSGNFSTASGVGMTWYETPASYEEQLLITMDKILSTFKFIEATPSTTITP